MCRWFRTSVPTLIGVFVLLVAALVLDLSAQNPQEPDPLVGTWILNAAKSNFTGRTPSKSGMRICGYSTDGLILCLNHTVNADGKASTNNFLIGYDKDYPEYGRGGGQKPTWMNRWKKIDARTKEFT